MTEDMPPEIPLLTEIATNPPDDLPLLTDLAQAAPPSSAAAPSSASLPHAIDTYIETVLAEKLKSHLAIAQQWAIETALAELKNELPQLILTAQNHTEKDR